MGLRLHSAVERPTRHLELIQLERLAHGTIGDFSLIELVPSRDDRSKAFYLD